MIFSTVLKSYRLIVSFMTPDDLRQQIELKVVEMIKQKLSDGTMTEERSQELSQIVLDTLKPGMSFEELYRAVPRLDDNASELSPIILPILRGYEQNVNKKALESVSDLIKQGQFDAAAKLADRAINQDVKLVWQGAGKPQ